MATGNTLTQLKQMPKVPTHDHNSISDDFWRSETLYLLEKVDGSNFRILLYDDRYDSLYPKEVMEKDPKDGDILIGLKSKLYGKTNSDQLDNVFNWIVSYLRDTIKTQQLYQLHSDYSSPLVLFGEYMLENSLDYNILENDVPPFIGFEVFPLREQKQDPPSNPFSETFDGFLPLNEAKTVFERCGLQMVPIVEKLTANSTEGDETVYCPSKDDIPHSEFGNAKAEGLVIRSDETAERAKLVSEEFEEQSRSVWGPSGGEELSGTEKFNQKFITKRRIEKVIQKLALRGPLNGNNVTETIAAEVLRDAWTENIPTIRSMNDEIYPPAIQSHVEDRADTVLYKMRKNAEINNTKVTHIWKNILPENEQLAADDIQIDTETWLSPTTGIVDSADASTAQLAEELITENQIEDVARSISEKPLNRTDRSVIDDAVQKMQRDVLWYEELQTVATIDAYYIPSELSREVARKTGQVLSNRL